MFLFEVKRLIWSALEIEFFELYFLRPILGGHWQAKINLPLFKREWIWRFLCGLKIKSWITVSAKRYCCENFCWRRESRSLSREISLG